MSSEWTGSSSSDVVLRCYAPPLLSEPYRHVVSGWGSARDKLSRRLGFIETLLRYLVAVYSAELGDTDESQYRTLLDRLHKPTLGMWWNAAYCLAKRVAVKPDAVAPELAGILVDTFMSRSPSKSMAAKKLENLIQVRNVAAHLDGATMPSEDEAEALLREIRVPLSTVLHGLSALQHYPLLCIDGIEPPLGTKVLRFTASGVDDFEVQAKQLMLKNRQVFLVSRAGDALCLDPWLRLEQRDGRCRVVLRNPRHKDDLKLLREQLPRVDAVVRGVFEPKVVEKLRGVSPDVGQPEIPGYSIDGLLGSGGAGSVWLARSEKQTSTERVALKVLHRSNIRSTQARQRLKREAEFLASQPHPSVVGFREFDHSPSNGPYLAMEYIQGMDLESRRQLGPIEPDEAARFVMEVLDGLEAAHADGHVHRDLKPSNLILDPRGRVRIIDFGIAAVAGATRITRTVDKVGTLDYMAPEQHDSAEVDARADIYSLGRVLEDLVRGGGGAEERGTLPPGLVAVVRRATQLQPEDRFQSVMEMKQALQERHRARWGGAPVMERDRLNDSFGVLRLRQQLGEQAWIFDGHSVATGDEFGLLVGAGGAAALLYAGDAAAPKDLRRGLEYVGLFKTAPLAGNSYPFLVFEGAHRLEERAARLLGEEFFALLTGRPAPPAAHPPPATPEPEPSPAPEPQPKPKAQAGPRPEPAAEAPPPPRQDEPVVDAIKDARKKKNTAPNAALIGVLAGGAVAGLAGAIGGAVLGSQIAKSRKNAAKARKKATTAPRKPTGGPRGK